MLESSVRKLYGCPWLIVAKYQCHKLPRICSVCRNHNPTLSSFMTYHGFVTRVTRQVALVWKELPTLPERLSSSPFSVVLVVQCFLFSFISTIVYLFVFCSAIVFCRFVLCSAIVLSVFLYFFQQLCCLSFCTLFSHCVVSLFVLSSAIVLSVFLYFVQPLCCLSFCTLFSHCIDCLFSNDGFWCK